MTPERWRQVGDLFEGAVRLEPGAREAWLREACGVDVGLRDEVGRLLARDERADQDGFLTPPGATDPPHSPTASWHAASTNHRRPAPVGDAPNCDGDGFTPREAIASPTGNQTISEPTDVVRARLRELPMVYILILAALVLWRRSVLGDGDLALYRADAAIVVSLAGLIALLSSRWPIPLAGLKLLELATVVTLAVRVAAGEYRMMLAFSLRGDVMMAQLVFKNVVLLTAVLILTYGLYVPKSWRRAALVAGPLAALPFATVLVMAAQYPTETSWLWKGWNHGTTPRAVLFLFDALLLIILAVGSTYGARTISRLRRQIAEARKLGQYCLGRRLGAGGMGEVYLAEHKLLKRPCAVKLIRPGPESGPNALERFEREVRLTAGLSHPNTVDVYDYGRAEDGTYYYVMEYLPGLNLDELVGRHGPLPPSRAVYLLRQVCGALREAHATGLIHRDIKPSNIFAAQRGGLDDVAKLLDFGLVHSVTESRMPRLSGEGRILGTPEFMSPEQATGGRDLDERSDIYSLGAVAYYLLTGRPPFDGDDGITVLVAHARDPVVPPSQIRPEIPEDLERVVLRCLAKSPADRFPDVRSLEQALAESTCAGEWDQEQAARWWRDAGQPSATPAAVN